MGFGQGFGFIGSRTSVAKMGRPTNADWGTGLAEFEASWLYGRWAVDTNIVLPRKLMEMAVGRGMLAMNCTFLEMEPGGGGGGVSPETRPGTSSRAPSATSVEAIRSRRI